MALYPKIQLTKVMALSTRTEFNNPSDYRSVVIFPNSMNGSKHHQTQQAKYSRVGQKLNPPVISTRTGINTTGIIENGSSDYRPAVTPPSPMNACRQYRSMQAQQTKYSGVGQKYEVPETHMNDNSDTAIIQQTNSPIQDEIGGVGHSNINIPNKQVSTHEFAALYPSNMSTDRHYPIGQVQLVMNGGVGQSYKVPKLPKNGNVGTTITQLKLRLVEWAIQILTFPRRKLTNGCIQLL